MQVGARAACAVPPLFSSLSILFSCRRALMFLFKKRAFLPGLPGPSLYSAPSFGQPAEFGQVLASPIAIVGLCVYTLPWR